MTLASRFPGTFSATFPSCYSYAIVPQLLETLDTDKTVITYERCVTQCFLFTLRASTEWFLWAVMDSDHYVAVCNPPFYVTAMTPQTCLALVLVHMLVACSIPQPLQSTPSQSPSVSPTRLNFFCDLPPLLKLPVVRPGYGNK